MNDIIVKMVHGSHLYGLNTINSDTDYKGIFLPTLNEIVQYNVEHEISKSTGPKHEKNSSGDIDEVMFSIQKFIKMCCDGETIAIDMLHANNDNIIESSQIWEDIVKNRQKFYTKNMKAFLGYCKNQARKYGIRGNNLRAIERTLEYLKTKDSSLKLIDSNIMFGLAELSISNSEYIKVFLDGFYKNGNCIKKQVLEVCGSKYDLNCNLKYVIEEMEKKYDSYGHRAKLAKYNDGLDFKALSHAIRVAYQLKEIYETGDLKYPLAKKDFILSVKQGKHDYMTVVAPTLESLIDEVEILANKSVYPEIVDRDYWKKFIVEVYQSL